MKYNFNFSLILILSVIFTGNTFSQCGLSNTCNPNSGLNSNDDAGTITYDNYTSAYHATVIKESSSQWKVWGANMLSNGADALVPTEINPVNYPGLTGTVYKVIVGSQNETSQLIVLTSDGLFTIGDNPDFQSGTVISNDITYSTGFHKIVVNGKQDGLPENVSPDDVRMLFATTKTLILTACTGHVYVLSYSPQVRGNGGVGSESQWSQVMVSPSVPLSDIIVTRGTWDVGFALKSDGTLWTWGINVFLGN